MYFKSSGRTPSGRGTGWYFRRLWFRQGKCFPTRIYLCSVSPPILKIRVCTLLVLRASHVIPPGMGKADGNEQRSIVAGPVTRYSRRKLPDEIASNMPGRTEAGVKKEVVTIVFACTFLLIPSCLCSS